MDRYQLNKNSEGYADFKKIEDLREEFKQEEIKQVDYEQLSFF